MALEKEEQVQTRKFYAMVDEVDSVLVDEARTPLIISGAVGQTDDLKEFSNLKMPVERLLKAQRNLVSQFLIEAKKQINANNIKDGGLALLRAHRGLPKNKPLIKYLSQSGTKDILLKTEGEYLQENAKRMPECDKELYFTIDEKTNNIDLTEKGIDLLTVDNQDKTFFLLPDISIELDKVDRHEELNEQKKLEKKEEIMSQYTEKAKRIHTIHQLLKAYVLFEKDKDYVIMDGKVKIVDEQTGRVLDGRRYSDGLHQALEAKEKVKIEEASQTYATITLQNFFRMYKKLAGMTGYSRNRSE